MQEKSFVQKCKHTFGMSLDVPFPVVSDGENECYFGYKDVFEHVPPFKAEEIDATGAGDSMVAGIVKSLLETNDGPVIDITK